MSTADTVNIASSQSEDQSNHQSQQQPQSAVGANLWIVDHQLKTAAQMDGVEIVPSPKAWQKFDWTRQYFKTEPKLGYFIWVKQQPACALTTCVNIQQAGVKQQMQNLVVIEPGLKAELNGLCSALSLKLKALHQAEGTIILKTGAQVKYDHRHRWGKEDAVMPHYEFILEKGSQIAYTYSTKRTSKKMELYNKFILADEAKVQFNIIAECEQTDFYSKDEIILRGDNAQATSTLRFISREQAHVRAESRMVAHGASSGHLDCQSLNLADSAQVSLVPEVVVNNSQAQITHEASIGRVSQEQLIYLRMRGLTEDEAVNLIAAGFLKI